MKKSTPIRCSTQPTFPDSLGAITAPYKFGVMPFEKQDVGLKTLTFFQCASSSMPSGRVRAKPGNKGTNCFLLIKDKSFSSLNNANQYTSKDESSYFLVKVPCLIRDFLQLYSFFTSYSFSINSTDLCGIIL